MRQWQHGTFYGYNNAGCRCKLCKSAWANYHRDLYHGVRVWASEKRTACCKRHVQKLHDVHKMPIAEIARRAWVPPSSVWNLYLGIPKRAKLENIKALWTVRADRS